MGNVSPANYKIVDGEFGPEPVSLRDDDDSIEAGCCSDDEHEHSLDDGQ